MPRQRRDKRAREINLRRQQAAEVKQQIQALGKTTQTNHQANKTQILTKPTRRRYSPSQQDAEVASIARTREQNTDTRINTQDEQRMTAGKA